MVNYVVDASVVISRLIHEASTPNARALFNQVRSPERLYVPEFCRLECVNVFWKHVRFQGMPQAQAEMNIRDLNALPLRVVPVTSLYVDAFQVGLTHQLAIYDSIYIALAKSLNCPLITLDQPQTRAALLEGVAIKPLTDFKA